MVVEAWSRPLGWDKGKGVTRQGLVCASRIGHIGAMASVRLPTPTDAEAVSSREDLVLYVQRLHAAIAAGEDVENLTLERFLEALAAWIEGCPRFFQQEGYEPPVGASWSFVAHALSAALIYE